MVAWESKRKCQGEYKTIAHWKKPAMVAARTLHRQNRLELERKKGTMKLTELGYNRGVSMEYEGLIAIKGQVEGEKTLSPAMEPKEGGATTLNSSEKIGVMKGKKNLSFLRMALIPYECIGKTLIQLQA